MKITLLPLGLLIALCIGAPPSLASPAAVDVSIVTLRQYLQTAGSKLHCHFTVENDSHWEMSIDSQGQREVVTVANDMLNDTITPTQLTTTPLLIDELRQALPDVDVFAEPGHLDIVHLVARSLEGDDNYIMNKKISLTVDLVPDRLLLTLAKMLNYEVGLPPMHLLNEPYGDMTTNLHITAHTETVRQILTNYIPLNGYASILWTSADYAYYDSTHQVQVKYAMVMASQ